MSKIRTNEGAVQYDHSLNHAVEFFSKAGSLFSGKSKKSFYDNETTAVELFKNVWSCGTYDIAMKLLFWLRDCRGGAGNRSGFRDCLKWLSETSPEWINTNISLIIDTGRYDDLRVLFGTPSENAAVNIWSDAIIKKDHLACKWADRSDKPLLKAVRVKTKTAMDIGDFRRLLAEGRKTIVEKKMCAKNWNEIEYPTVPSVAMSRYTNAFKKNDTVRFEKFKEKVVNGEVKINASTLFPHDCVRTSDNGDSQTADLQFAALPDYMDNKKNRILCLCDSSGSMSVIIGGSVRAVDVSRSLSLYCSDRIGKDNPFYRKFIEFESESKFKDWKGKSFSETLNTFNGACGSTRIDKALMSILGYAKMFNVKNEDMPNYLLILSDMQFTDGVLDIEDEYDNGTPVEQCMSQWVKAGYTIPKIVYWNLAGYAGQPATANSNGIGLVSGFSPAILNAVFAGQDFSPVAIMLRAIEKYKVNIPV